MFPYPPTETDEDRDEASASDGEILEERVIRPPKERKTDKKEQKTIEENQEENQDENDDVMITKDLHKTKCK